MDSTQMAIINFGATLNDQCPIILKSGSIVPRQAKFRSERESLQTVVSRIYAFSVDFTQNTRLFSEFYEDQPHSSWTKRKAACVAVSTNIEHAKASATNLKARLVEHKTRLTKEIADNPKFYSIIKNFFRQKKIEAFDRLILTLAQAETNFFNDRQVRPVVPPRVYVDKESYEQLFLKCGFTDDLQLSGVPSVRSELAAFAEGLSYTEYVILAEEDVVQGDTEANSVTSIVVQYLESKFPQASVAIAKRVYPQIITGRQCQNAINLLEDLEHLNSTSKIKTLLTAQGFDKHLSKTDFNALIAHIQSVGDLYLSKSNPLSSELDKGTLASLLNGYLRSKKADHIDTSDVIIGERFSMILADQVGGYEAAPMTKDRAKQLLSNLGYSETPMFNDLAKFLEGKLSLHHEAKLSTPAEIRTFNAAVLDFLNTLSSTPGEPCELDALFRESGEPIPAERVTPTFQLLKSCNTLGRLTTLFRKSPKNLLKNLLKGLNFPIELAESQLDRLTAMLIAQSFNINLTAATITEEQIETLNSAICDLFIEKFSDKADLITRTISLHPTSIDFSLLLGLCRDEISPTNALEFLRKNGYEEPLIRLKLPAGFLSHIAAQVRLAGLYMVDPLNPTEDEINELNFVLSRILNKLYPNARKEILGKISNLSNPEDFARVCHCASLADHYSEDSSVSMSPIEGGSSPPVLMKTPSPRQAPGPGKVSQVASKFLTRLKVTKGRVAAAAGKALTKFRTGAASSLDSRDAELLFGGSSVE